MPSSGVFELVAFSAIASADVLPLVDVSDATQAPQGSLKKITVANFFTAIPVSVSMAVNLNLTGASNNSAIRQDRAWVWTNDGTDGGTIRGSIYVTAAGVVTLGAGASNTSVLALALAGSTLSTTGRASGTSSTVLTLADSVTGAQTVGQGLDLAWSSNAGATAAKIRFAVGGSGGNNESQLGFFTQNVAAGLTEYMRLTSVGVLSLFGGALTVNKTGATSYIEIADGGVQGWSMGVSHPSGDYVVANNGSALAGGDKIRISASTFVTTFSAAIKVTNQVQSVGGDLDLDSVSGGANAVRINRSGGTGGLIVFKGNTTTVNLLVADNASFSFGNPSNAATLDVYSSNLTASFARLTVASTGVLTIAPGQGAGASSNNLNLTASTTALSGGLTTVGNVSVGAELTATSGSCTIAGSGTFLFSGRGGLNAPSDGVFRMSDNAGTSFGRLQFGGTTSSFPSIKRNAAALNFRLADDSADAAITAGAITATGAILASGASIKSSSASDGVGYATGAGGTVTQITSFGTGVTLNKICGQITTVSGSPAAGNENSFVVTNSAVASTDTVVVSLQNGGTVTSDYAVVVKAVAAGSFTILVTNLSGAGVGGESLIINFAVIKAVTS